MDDTNQDTSLQNKMENDQDVSMDDVLQQESQDSQDSTDEDESEEYEDDASSETLSWIKWFCTRPGNEILIQVPYEYVEDNFNLTDLDLIIPNMEDSLNIILDYEVKKEIYQQIERSAQVLYGLIHSRYILSKQGMNDAYARFLDSEYGICPRALCEANPLLPVGLSDKLGVECVKMYCTRCMDIYYPKQRYAGIDGAFFGRTFPHLFELTFSDHLSSRYKGKDLKIMVPKIYGFKVNETLSAVGNKCTWLREL